VWKVAFDRESIKGPLLSTDAQELVFEARLNQNLDFKATFPMAEIIPAASAEKVENAKPDFSPRSAVSRGTGRAGLYRLRKNSRFFFSGSLAG
jgi:hypothetical protein